MRAERQGYGGVVLIEEILEFNLEMAISREEGVPKLRKVRAATVFATGGIQNGLDIARAIALGASCGGIARAALQALEKDGPSGARRFFDGVEAELRAALLLTGSADLSALRNAPRVIVGELKDWLAPHSG